MSELAPDELAVPSASVSTFGKLKFFFGEGSYDCVDTAMLAKTAEEGLHHVLHFLVWIEDDVVFSIIDVADG